MKRNTLRILSALLAMIFVLFAFSSCGKKVSKNPDEAILNAIETTQKLAAKNEMAATLEKYSDFNVMEYNINLSDLIGSVFSAAMGGMNVSLSSELDLNMKLLLGENSSHGTLALLLNNTDFIRLDAYASAEELALASEALLGDTAYGISFDTFLAWYEEQLGDVTAGISIPLTEMLEQNANAFETTEQLADTFDKYWKLAVKTLFENADAVRTEETVTVNGESAKAVVFTTAINEATIQKVAEKLYTTYKNDTEARTTVENILKQYGMTDEDIAGIYADLENAIAETPADSSETVNLCFVINAQKGNLIEISLTDVDDTEALTLTFGIDPENPTYFAFTSPDASLAYRMTENTEANYAAELTVTADGETVQILVSYDKTTNQYTMSATDFMTISGILKAEQDALIFSIDDVTATIEGQTVAFKMGLTMTFSKSNETVPAVPEYTDVTKMTEEDFAALGDELLTTLNELILLLPTDLQFLLGSLMGG